MEYIHSDKVDSIFLKLRDRRAKINSQIITSLHFLPLGGWSFVDVARHSGDVTLSIQSWPWIMYGGNSKSMLNISIPYQMKMKWPWYDFCFARWRFLDAFIIEFRLIVTYLHIVMLNYLAHFIEHEFIWYKLRIVFNHQDLKITSHSFPYNFNDIVY